MGAMATFSLLTLNCFGGIAPNTRRRLLTLAHELNRTDAVVVCLQEVQLHAHCRLLVRECSSYSSSAYLPFLHAPKGGLLTLGRTDFDHAYFTIYRERGLWYTLGAADWLLHKGVLCTTLEIERVPVVVLNTHLNANYDGDWRRSNRFAQSEWRQLEQLAEVVQAQPANALVVVAGDFNIPRGSWLYYEFLALTGLSDPLAHDMRPTYRGLPGLSHHFQVPIDFTLLRAPGLPGLRVAADLAFCSQMTFSNGGGRGYLSDHCGVMLRVVWADEAGEKT
jgi:endonuclease/exonuclease/phosphatase family metal-dependent hydrolase